MKLKDIGLRPLCASGRLLFPLVLFSLAGSVFAQAPTWDTSGNRLLNGAYNFREVAWIVSANGSGNLSRAVAQWGTITFNGNGGFTLTSTVRDSSLTGPQSYNI